MAISIPVPCLCLVTDRRLCESNLDDLVNIVALAVKGGADIVQLREKDMPGGELLDLAERLREVTQGSALLFINDRVDVAVACGADGVQLGEHGLPVEAARKIVREKLLIGRSVHGPEGAVAAESAGADLLVVGAVFPTASHTAVQPGGPRLLSEIAGLTDIPVLGIGGISATNVAQVIDRGAVGAAVISAILSAEDPYQATRQLKQAIGVAWAKSNLRRDQDPMASAHKVRPRTHG